MLTQTIISFLAILSVTGSVFGQPRVSIDHLKRFQDTVIVGDSAAIDLYKLSADCYPCPGVGSGSVHVYCHHGRAWLGSVSGENGNALFYCPNSSGHDTIEITFTVACSGARSCSLSSTANAYTSVFAQQVSSGVVVKEDALQVRFTNSLDNALCQFDRGQRITLDIFDLTGRLLHSIERDVPAGTSEIDLGMSNLAPGCYWYVVRGNGWRKSGKVMKLP